VRAFLLTLLCILGQQAPPRDLPARREGGAPSGTASISGRVRAAGSGAAVPALVVLVAAPLLDSATAASWREEVAKTGIVTDRSGRFSITGIGSGTYRLIAAPSSQSGRYLAAGYGATRANDPGKPIVVRDGDDIRNADITLPTALAIEGRVVDEAGEPLSRMSVVAGRIMAGSEIAQRVPQTSIATDDLGRYRIYGLQPGEYVVAVENAPFVSTPVTWPGARNFGGAFTGDPDPTTFVTTFYPSSLSESSAQRVRLTAPNDVIGIDITLIRTGHCQVSGTVLDSQGVAAPNTHGMLLHPGIGHIGNHPFMTDASGRFQVRGLDPGDYRLLVGGDVWPGLSPVNGRAEFADMALSLSSDLPDLAVVTQAGARVSGRVVFADAPPTTLPAIRLALRRPDDRTGRTTAFLRDRRVRSAAGARVVTAEGMGREGGDAERRRHHRCANRLQRRARRPSGGRIDVALVYSRGPDPIRKGIRRDDGLCVLGRSRGVEHVVAAHGLQRCAGGWTFYCERAGGRSILRHRDRARGLPAAPQSQRGILRSAEP